MDKNTAEWVKLEVGNDWEAIYYAYPGERLNAYGTADARNGLLLTNGQKVTVRFPDGKTKSCTLVRQLSQSGYSDHGHSHQVTQTRYGVEVTTHGVVTWIPIESVEVIKGSFEKR